MKKKELKKRLEREKQAKRKLKIESENPSFKAFIWIFIGVFGFVLLMFVFTKVKTGEWNLFTRKNNINYVAEITNSKILCGGIFDREPNEYYVLAYAMKEDNASLYDSIIERYQQNEVKIPVYSLDLSNSRNGICKSDTLHISNSADDIFLVEPTLLRIKDQKVIASYTTYEMIQSLLTS